MIDSLSFLTLGRTRKFIPPPCYKGEGIELPPRVFDMLQYFETILPSVEMFDFLNMMRQDDVTNDGRHVGFYQELEIRLKTREMVIFLCLT